VAFLGGPDLLLEVLSEDDDTYAKFPFYAGRGVREILIVDPETYRTELWELREKEYERSPEPPVSAVTGLVLFGRPDRIEVHDPGTGHTWEVR